jgi:hypothetical protein
MEPVKIADGEDRFARVVRSRAGMSDNAGHGSRAR